MAEMAQATDVRRVLMSISQLAFAFGMTRETVGNKLREHGVEPAGERGGYPVYALDESWRRLIYGRQDIFEELGMHAVDYTDAASVDRLPPKARLDAIKGNQARDLELEQKGDLVRRQAVREQMAVVLKACTQMLDTLPDLLERDCQLPAAAVDRVERELDQVRAGLAEQLGDRAQTEAAAA